MKFLAYLGSLIIVFGFFYAIGNLGVGYTSKHPTLNAKAIHPDLHLHNAKHYTKEFGTDRSLYHLEKAISSMKTIETDMDTNTSEKVDIALLMLQEVYQEIQSDALNTADMNHAFEYTLKTLALAELRVSERYAESNHPELAFIALKYAQLHIKNAMQYAYLPSLEKEQNLYRAIDSILSHQSEPAVIITERVDHLIVEINKLIN